MNRTILTAVIVASATPAIAGSINSVDAQGYLTRAARMIDNRNFEGALDQLNHLTLLSPTPSQTETALYLTARAYQGLGDDEALDRFTRFIEQYPASPLYQNALMGIGDYYFTRSAYSEAITAYRRVNPKALNDALAEEYFYRLAYCYMLSGDYATADGLFNRLIGTSTYGNAASYYIAYMAYARRDYDRALQLFKAVNTSVAPGNAASYYIAQIYFIKRDYNNALDAARRALAVNPVPEFDAETRRIAGESLYNLGQTDEALPYLWKYVAAAQDPAPSAFYILGTSEYQMGNIDNAIKLLQRAITEDDVMGQSAYLTLGQAYNRRGDSTAALMAFERATRMDYNSALTETAAYNYAVTSIEGGRTPFGSSVKLFEDFLNKYPTSAYASQVSQYIINGYMIDNDYESALAAINRISNPSSEVLALKQRVLFMIGTRQYSAGKIATAMATLKECERLGQYDPTIAAQCWMWLGDCAYRMDSYDEAAGYYRRYIDSPVAASDSKTKMLAWYDLGYARMGQERWDDALTDFERVVNAPAADLSTPAMRADAMTRAADCLYYMSRFGEAAAYYKRAYDANTDAGDYALFQLAMMKGFQRNYTGKIDDLDLLMQSFPTSGFIPAALLEKGDTYVALNNSNGAIAIYNTLIDTYPGTSQGRNGMLRLAITQLNIGRRQDAIATYRRVIKTYPSSEEARLAADDLKRIAATDGTLDQLDAFLRSVEGAPSLEAAEVDELTFRAAEADYINAGKTARLDEYLTRFPNGSYASVAMYYIVEDAWNAGDNNRAITLADKLLQTYPDTDAAEDVMIIKAEAQSAIGKKAGALKTWQALEERASGASVLQAARMGIVRTATATGNNDLALATADKLLSTTAGTPEIVTEVKYYRGLALKNMRDYDRADKQWLEIATMTDDPFGAQAAYESAQTLFDRGKTSAAKTRIDAFINANPPHAYWLARGFILYSDILRAQGNTFEADEYLKSLRTNYPGSENDIFTLINQRLK